MEDNVLVARWRTGKGKEEARRLRHQGLIPAVVYGPSEAPIPITLSPQNLAKALRGASGERTLIDLTIEGLKDGPITKTVILKEKQTDPVKKTLLHADLYIVAMGKEISVGVPVHVVGKAVGVEKGGVLDQIIREIEVKCLPANIPPRVELDVSSLDIGDAIHVGNIQLERANILTDPEQTVVTVVPPTVLEEPVAEAEIVEEEEEEEKEKEEIRDEE